jgi:hypothetical protein
MACTIPYYHIPVGLVLNVVTQISVGSKNDFLPAGSDSTILKGIC